MTRKVHRVVQHAVDFDTFILHSKQDGMAAVGMKLRAQAPAAWGNDVRLQLSDEPAQPHLILVFLHGAGLWR